MPKEVKNVINKKKAENYVLDGIKAECFFYGLMFVIMSVVTIPISLICILSFLYESFWYLTVIAGLIVATPSIVFAVLLTIRIVKYVTLVKRGFRIVEAEVTKKIKYDKPEAAQKVYLNAIYFGKYGRMSASSTIFDMSTEGDLFYLLVNNSEKSPEIFSAYPQKTYEYKE